MKQNKRFFFEKDNATDVVVVDLNGDLIRLVHAKELNGQIQIIRIQRDRILPDREGAISSFVSNFARSLKSKTRKVIVSVSSNAFISKNVDIPSKDPDEIRKIIDLQSGRFTPYAREEIVLDWFCMETPEQHYTNVLLVIIQRKTVERYCAILEHSGLEVDRIVLAPEALSVVYDSKSAAVTGELEASGGVFMGAESSDFTISDNHQMVFVRSIPIGFKQLTADSENAYRTLMDELNKSINAYKDQGFGKSLKNLYLLGTIPDSDLLERNIRDQVPFITLNSVTVSILSEPSSFSLGESSVEELKKQGDVTYFDLCAVATYFSKLRVDLIPKEIKMKHQVREGGRDIITLGITIMTIMLLLSVFLVAKTFLKKEQIKKLDKMNESSFGEARTLEQVSTKSKVLKSLIKTRGKGLYVFEKINSMIGEDIYLNAFNFDKEGAISFGGTAESMSRVFAFVNELEESNYFKDVKTKETKSRREAQKEVADFSIECIMTEGV